MQFNPKQTETNSDSNRRLKTCGSKGVLCGFLLSALLFCHVHAAGISLPIQYELTFGWNPAQSPAVTGYKLHYGTATGDNTKTVDLGNVSSAIIPGFVSGVTYYFAITAYNSSGQEGAPSDEIIYGRDVPGIRLPQFSSGKFMLNLTGPANGMLDVEATTDFKTWTVIDTVTLGTSGALNFNDTNAAAFSRRFYRTRQF